MWRVVVSVGWLVLAGCGDGSGGVHFVGDAGPDALPFGAPCKVALDCLDPGLAACDPATHTCVPTTCADASTCGPGEICLIEAGDRGLCRPTCTPVGDAGCPAGETCVFASVSGVGTCVDKGSAALGATCEINDVDTGCADGVCRRLTQGDLTGTCVAVCDPFGTTSPCDGSHICSATYDCSVDGALADSAGVEELCAKKDAPCAIENGLERGFCITIYSVNVCRPGCRLGVPSDCPASTICVQPPPISKASNLGVCEPALDNSACVDGGSGTCAECRALEEGSGGCCATEMTSCTTSACLAFLDCAIACKRSKTCVDACIAADPAAAVLGEPAFLCLSGYGAPPGGACGDVCGGLAVCGNYDGPDTASTCTTCPPANSGCRANGCFNGFYCERTTMTCTSPLNVPSCSN